MIEEGVRVEHLDGCGRRPTLRHTPQRPQRYKFRFELENIRTWIGAMAAAIGRRILTFRVAVFWAGFQSPVNNVYDSLTSRRVTREPGNSDFRRYRDAERGTKGGETATKARRTTSASCSTQPAWPCGGLSAAAEAGGAAAPPTGAKRRPTAARAKRATRAKRTERTQRKGA